MFNIEKEHFWIVGLSVAILTFVLLFVGITRVANQEVSSTNMIAYVVFSLLTGSISALFVYFKLTIALISFDLGLIFGFIDMYRSFIRGMDGWGDLLGILALFAWCIGGLVLGLLAQLGYYLFKRFSK